MRLALNKPALPSAPSKKSFSSVSSPILAWSDFTSTAGCAVPLPPPGPNTSAAPSSSCAFHDVICIGVNVELRRKLSQCSIAAAGRERHPRLEGPCVVPAWSFGD